MNRRVGVPALACLVLYLTGCGPSKILLSPVPSQIQSIEGHARIWLTNPEGSRTKFSFLLFLPDHGSIEVSNFLGQSLYRILITSEGAFLVIPSKKVYWQGIESEIMDRFLGFPLDLDELIGLISGQWSSVSQKKLDTSHWSFIRDSQGRIRSGLRDALCFSVEEFIPETPFPRSLRFEHPTNSGRLKILKMELNRSFPQAAFDSDYLQNYAAKTWEEIQALLNDAG